MGRFINSYYIIILIILLIMFTIYRNNSYIKDCKRITNKSSEKIISDWNLEDEISKFTIKQDMLFK
jgi:predicted Holliday junction resolvase-like endonuclease